MCCLATNFGPLENDQLVLGILGDFGNMMVILVHGGKGKDRASRLGKHLRHFLKNMCDLTHPKLKEIWSS